MHHLTTIVLATALLTSGAGSALAEGRSPTMSASAQETSQTFITLPLGLAGYSPVSYLDSNRAEPGSPRFAAEYKGVTYFLASEAQRRSFLASPERYLPAYGGYCAFGCSVNARFIPDPTSFKVIGGRTHLFLKNAEVDARKLWNEADPADVQAKADQFWMSQHRSRAYINGRNVPASGIALDGYSPVSYFTVGRPEKGDARFSVEHNGVTYHFTSAEQVALFKKNPSKYEPQCGGWCAFGMSIEDKFPVDPTSFKIVEGRLFLFLNNEQVQAADLWAKGDSAALLQKAEAHWKKVSGN